MTSLETAALWWLVNERRCMLVLRERSPRRINGRPDVLGVTRHRYAIEIEVKRSRSDFHRDASKWHRRYPNPNMMPKQFYYLLPHGIAVTITPPKGSGLMGLHENAYHPTVIQEAPINPCSRRYTLKECVRLACEISSFALSTHLNMERMRSGVEWPQDYAI